MTMSTSGEHGYGPLLPGQVITTETSRRPCVVGCYLGGGSQGDVYEANLGGASVAVKWYVPSWAGEEQHRALQSLLRRRAPGPAFLWPVDTVTAPGVSGFGYVMPLRESRYRSMVDLIRHRTDATFRTLATAGMWLAHNFLLLHAEGLCYRDISFGNMFFDPATGEVLICDTDNVGVDGTATPLLGTPRFMAPEIVRGDALPSSAADLHALAVLLFYLFMSRHPLEAMGCLPPRSADLGAMRSVYGVQPLFVFDRPPTPTLADRQARELWLMYPEFIRRLFERTFRVGLSDPMQRVREGEWRDALAALRDLVVYCRRCAAQNFAHPDPDLDFVGLSCWRCEEPVQLPLYLQLETEAVMLNYDSQLYPHHVDSSRRWDFSRACAAVVQHPRKRRWGLRNDGVRQWTAVRADGTPVTVDPGRTLRLAVGMRIDFGSVVAAVADPSAHLRAGARS